MKVSQALGQRVFLLLEGANKAGKNRVWGSEMNRNGMIKQYIRE